MSAKKTSSSQSENEPLAKEAIMDEKKNIDNCEIKQDQTRNQYDETYWKRAMRTGCMIMVFISYVSLSRVISTFELDGATDITFSGNH